MSDKIVECAAAHDAGIVILGTHGYGPVEKYFVGTTTDKVMRKTMRPILTVRI